jgi:hypothetical protein
MGCYRLDRLAQDRDKCRALVNVVIKAPGSTKCGEFLEKFRTRQFFRKESALRG